jgi:hypothetical protein
VTACWKGWECCFPCLLQEQPRGRSQEIRKIAFSCSVTDLEWLPAVRVSAIVIVWEEWEAAVQQLREGLLPAEDSLQASMLIWKAEGGLKSMSEI